MNTIHLQPLGSVDENVLEFLIQRLSSIRDVMISPPLDVPKLAYNPARRQFDASRLLSALPDTQDIVLGITEEDAYVEGLNYIFGLASGNKALISLKRLRPEFYGLKEDGEQFKLRALKEAMHELGHVLGLGHCPDRRCVMHFSNSISDTDYKDWRYCRQCLAKLSLQGII
jgi:archaemetzincin